MSSEAGKGRALKKRVLDLLNADDFERALEELRKLPGLQAANALFSLLLNRDEMVRWRAVTGMGVVAAALAEEDVEGVRTIMRRLMWSLNEESGGIGWGAPESMSEIMACHEGLAHEYGKVFISYLDREGNYLEYEILQRGLMWGLVRLAGVWPTIMQAAAPHIAHYLPAKDATVRGLAAHAAGLLGVREARAELLTLLNDESEFTSYVDRKVVRLQVKQLAHDALAHIAPEKPD